MFCMIVNLPLLSDIVYDYFLFPTKADACWEEYQKPAGKSMESWTLSLLFLTVLLLQRGTCGQKSVDPTVPGEEGTHDRQPGPAGQKGGRCAYTFVVPQQRLTGSLCITSRRGESGVANSSDVAALREELTYQQRQLEEVRALVVRESDLAQEVRGWRGENAGLNARIAQMNAELLQQILHSKEQAQAQQRLQELLLNITTQVRCRSSSRPSWHFHFHFFRLLSCILYPSCAFMHRLTQAEAQRTLVRKGLQQTLKKMQPLRRLR